MIQKIRVLILTISLILFTLACSGSIGNDDIVGRWVFYYDETNTSGAGDSFEFYSDGTCTMQTSTGNYLLEYSPMMGGVLPYSFDIASGVLDIFTPDNVAIEMQWGNSYNVAFITKDEITMKVRSMSRHGITSTENLPKNVKTYKRMPLPDLPWYIRTQIGQIMLGKTFTLVESKQLNENWEKEYPDYVAVAVTDITFTVGGTQEQWLAIIQVESEVEPRIYVLTKSESGLGVFQLIKN